MNMQSAVGAQIDGLTSRKARYWVPILLGLIMLGDSYDNLVVAYAMPSLQKEWGLDSIAIGMLISAGYGGQVVGLLTLGPAAERIGRIPVFIGGILAMSVLSAACAFAQSKDLFMALRFLQGIALGGAIPACTSYVNELAPTASRGRYFSVFQFLLVSGYSLASLAAALVIPSHGWRMMFLLGAAPALLLPLVLLTLPESPRWLARHGRFDAANRALARFGARGLEEGLPSGPIAPKTPPMLILLAPEYRKLTIIISLLWFLASLVGYTFATWIPTFYVQVYHLSIEQALHYSAIAGGIYLFVPLIFAAIIDRVGRRLPAILVSATAGIALAVLTLIDPSRTSLIVILITTGWVAAAAAVIILVPYTAEIFPTQIRAVGMGMSTAFARGASMLTPLVVGGTLAFTGSIDGVFALLAVASLAGAVIWTFYAQETARKSLEEIEKH